MVLNTKYILSATLLVASLALFGCSDAEHVGEDAVSQENAEAIPIADTEPDAEAQNASVVSEDAPLDWCYEHSVPESVCTQCNPSLIEQFTATGDWCPPHDLPESHCRLCNPEIVFEQEFVLRERAMEQADGEIAVSLFFRDNSRVCATNDALIQFASLETADRMGLSVRPVRSHVGNTAIEAPAEVVFDETTSTVVTSTVPTMISNWLVGPGAIVTGGEVLAIAQSPEIASLEADLLTAFAANEVQQKEVARHRELMNRNLISALDFDQQTALGEKTRADYVALRGLLKTAGLSEADLDDIVTYKKISSHFALRAPADGVLVERIARVGKLLPAGEAFALMADPSAMWIEANLTDSQLRQVQVGESVTFTSDGRVLNQVGGKVIWVSRFLDPHTRTGKVRAEVLDRSHNLNAGEFGRMRIVKSGDDHVVLVPKDAVQWEGCCNVVFVKEAVDRYRPRKIEFSDGEGSYYQVTRGLQAGEEVVVDGAFLLKTELKKSSIGAGCCGIEPVG